MYYNCFMIELSIPGRGIIRLEHLVCDVNGTLAVDGKLVDGVSRMIGGLRDRLTVHLLTADTFGRQDVIDQQLNLTAVRLQTKQESSSLTGPASSPPQAAIGDYGFEARQKADYIRQLGTENVVAIGQGANDALMLRSAAVGICLVSPEGLAVETLQAADVVAPDILAALEMLVKPLRLVATLRR